MLIAAMLEVAGLRAIRLADYGITERFHPFLQGSTGNWHLANVVHLYGRFDGLNANRPENAQSGQTN